MIHLPRQVTIHAVGPSEGFQPEERRIPTKTKIEFVDALSATGLPMTQVSSFVHPRAIPNR